MFQLFWSGWTIRIIIGGLIIKMKLRRTVDGKYTLKEEVDGEKTKDAHYKFVKIRDVKEKFRKELNK